MSWYLWLKALHVLAASLWLGAAAANLLIMGLMLRTTDLARMGALANAGDAIGRRLIGPGGGIVLLAGIATTVLGHLGMPLWILIGVLVSLVMMTFGGILLGRGLHDLAVMLESPQGREAEIAAFLKRLRVLGVAAVTILVLTVVVMVLKPTL